MNIDEQILALEEEYKKISWYASREECLDLINKKTKLLKQKQKDRIKEKIKQKYKYRQF